MGNWYDNIASILDADRPHNTALMRYEIKTSEGSHDLSDIFIIIDSKLNLEINFHIPENKTLINKNEITIYYGKTLTNNGTIINDASGVTKGTITNVGTVNNNGIIINEGKNIQWGVAAKIVNRGYINSSGTITSNGDINNSASLTNSGTFLNDASGTLTQAYVLNNYGTLTNSGTLNNTGLGGVSGYARLKNGTSGVVSLLTNSGTLTNGIDDEIHNYQIISNTNDGTINNDWIINNNYVDGTIYNDGTINNNNDGTINNVSGTIYSDTPITAITGTDIQPIQVVIDNDDNSTEYKLLPNSNMTGANLTNKDLSNSYLFGANFTSAILIGTNFTDSSLNNADFSGADLSGADLSGANLTNANFTNATLTNAIFTNATLTGVTSSGITPAYGSGVTLPAGYTIVGGKFVISSSSTARTVTDVTNSSKTYIVGPGIDMSGANLTNLDLSNADLSGAKFTSATLIRTDFTDSSLNFADFSGADLSGADLTGATLTDADLTDADLTNADLSGADLTGATLTDATLTDADLTDADLTKATLHDADFTDSVLKNANFTDSSGDFVDLNYADLSGADLTGADWWTPTLTNANLTNANLTNATLHNADLSGASLSGADLSGAHLTDVQFGFGITFTATNFYGANLSGSTFKSGDRYVGGVQTYLTGLDFSGANLHATEIEGVILTNANLTNANLSYAEFTGAYTDLWGATLTNANLEKATLGTGGVDLSGADLSGADLSGADLRGVRFDYATLTNANFTNAEFGRGGFGEVTTSSTSFSHVDLTNADFTGANLRYSIFTDVPLTNATLTNVNLIRADLISADLSGADLSGADLSGAFLDGATLWGATLTNANLTNADLSGADLTNATLNGADFTNTKIEYANFTNATFTGTFSKNIQFSTDVIFSEQYSVISGFIVGPNIDFEYDVLQNVNFTGINLTGADFSGADLSGADLSGANLTNANFTNATLTNAIFTNATLTGVTSSGITPAYGSGVTLPAGYTIVGGKFVPPSNWYDPFTHSLDSTLYTLSDNSNTLTLLSDVNITINDTIFKYTTIPPGKKVINFGSVCSGLYAGWELDIQGTFENNNELKLFTPFSYLRVHPGGVLINDGWLATSGNVEIRVGGIINHSVSRTWANGDTGSNAAFFGITNLGTLNNNGNIEYIRHLWNTGTINNTGVIEIEAASRFLNHIDAKINNTGTFSYQPKRAVWSAGEDGGDIIAIMATDNPDRLPQSLMGHALPLTFEERNKFEMKGKNLSNGNFSNINLTNVDFTGADLSGGIFTSAILIGTNFTDSSLNNADFSGADLSGADLSGANLTYATLTNANFTNATLTNATLTNANFTNATLTGVTSSGITLDDGSGVTLPAGYTIVGGKFVYKPTIESLKLLPDICNNFLINESPLYATQISKSTISLGIKGLYIANKNIDVLKYDNILNISINNNIKVIVLEGFTVGENYLKIDYNYGTITTNNENGVITNNNGTIKDNNGLLTNNNYYGIVDNHSNIMTNNYGLVKYIREFSVGPNWIGSLTNNHPSGIVVKIATSSSGEGTITDNHGFVFANNGLITNNYGTLYLGHVAELTTNRDGGTVTKNYGLVMDIGYGFVNNNYLNASVYGVNSDANVNYGKVAHEAGQISNGFISSNQIESTAKIPTSTTDRPYYDDVYYHLSPGGNMSYANLSGIDLSNADLSGVIFTNAQLIRTDFTDSSLNFADFSGADLSGADLSGANLTNANFTNATLTNAIFTNATLTGVTSSGITPDDGAGVTLPTGYSIVGGKLMIVPALTISPTENVSATSYTFDISTNPSQPFEYTLTKNITVDNLTIDASQNLIVPSHITLYVNYTITNNGVMNVAGFVFAKQKSGTGIIHTTFDKVDVANPFNTNIQVIFFGNDTWYRGVSRFSGQESGQGVNTYDSQTKTFNIYSYNGLGSINVDRVQTSGTIFIIPPGETLHVRQDGSGAPPFEQATTHMVGNGIGNGKNKYAVGNYIYNFGKIIIDEECELSSEFLYNLGDIDIKGTICRSIVEGAAMLINFGYIKNDGGTRPNGFEYAGMKYLGNIYNYNIIDNHYNIDFAQWPHGIDAADVPGGAFDTPEKREEWLSNGRSTNFYNYKDAVLINNGKIFMTEEDEYGTGRKVIYTDKQVGYFGEFINKLGGLMITRKKNDVFDGVTSIVGNNLTIPHLLDSIDGHSYTIDFNANATQQYEFTLTKNINVDNITIDVSEILIVPSSIIFTINNTLTNNGNVYNSGTINVNEVFGNPIIRTVTDVSNSTIYEVKPDTNMSGANLTNLDLSNADLSGAKFTSAILIGTNFTDSSLNNADFSGADLTGADLTGVNLTKTNFTNANLAGVISSGITNFNEVILPTGYSISSGEITVNNVSSVLTKYNNEPTKKRNVRKGLLRMMLRKMDRNQTKLDMKVSKLDYSDDEKTKLFKDKTEIEIFKGKPKGSKTIQEEVTSASGEIVLANIASGKGFLCLLEKDEEVKIGLLNNIKCLFRKVSETEYQFSVYDPNTPPGGIIVGYSQPTDTNNVYTHDKLLEDGDSVTIDGTEFTIGSIASGGVGDTTQQSSSVVGDPYVCSLKTGEVWKMPNFEGYSRMLQGTIDNQQLTINVKTTFNTDEEIKETVNYVMKWSQTMNVDYATLLRTHRVAAKRESFMRELWVQYGEKEMRINMEQLIASNNAFSVSQTDNQAFMVDYDCHDSNNLRIDLTDNLYIIISKFDNPQVKTGFSLKGNTSQIKNTSGALCNKLYKEDMILEEITSIEPIQQLEDRIPKGNSNEIYYNTEGNKVSKSIPYF